MKLELLSFVLPLRTSSPMIRQAAVATYLPSGYDGTGVVGNVGGGELGRSADILIEDVLRCLAIELVLSTACTLGVGWIAIVTLDRSASVLMMVFEESSRRAGNRASCSMHTSGPFSQSRSV